MIRFSKYNADWKPIRNGFKFRRSNEAGGLIWPLQKVYTGLSQFIWPREIYWLTSDEYLVLKIKGQI